MNESHVKWSEDRNHYFLPIFFRCPICQKQVKECNQDGTQVGCKCIVVDYDGRRLAGLDNIIPGPSELLPQCFSGEAIDVPSIQEETAFRWGQLVKRQLVAGARPEPNQ